MGNVEIFGGVAWLFCQSSLHKEISINSFAKNAIPPIALKQHVILWSNEMPMAYVSWAFLSQDVERKYINNPIINSIQDWRSGDRLWIIDFISPFSIKYTFELKSILKNNFPNRFARALRVRCDNKVGTIHTYAGFNLPDDWRALADRQILSSFLPEVAPEKRTP